MPFIDVTRPADEPAAAPKPGWKSSEFWLALLAQLLAWAMAAGVFPSDSPWEKVAAIALAGLSAHGYAASRGKVKAAATFGPTIQIK